MEDKNSISESCKEIIDLINNKADGFKKEISEKDQKIEYLEKALVSSESRRETAEEMLSKIKDEANSEIRKAYQDGYNAASFNSNPTGGTTISQDQTKTLTLNNQN